MVVVAYEFSVKVKSKVAASRVKAKFPVVAIRSKLRIGNGSTADYRASPEPMIIREAKISPSNDVCMDFDGQRIFLCIL